MFGYIKPLKPEMKIREFDTYQAVYCGLCKQLGASFGPFARLTLSYDFAFLAMLSMSLQEEPPVFHRERCFVNPLKKKFCCKCSSSSHFSGCVAMIMLYHKARDNWADSRLGGKLLAALSLPFCRNARRKAAAEHPEVDAVISQCMEKQAQIEAASSPLVDEAAEPSAQALSFLCKTLSQDPIQQRVLERLGYLLGRWVYCIDALDDLKDDLKNGNYNPYLKAWQVSPNAPLPPGCVEEAVASLYATTAEISASYELLTLYHYKPILDNIIYLGLKNSVDVIRKKRSDENDRSI